MGLKATQRRLENIILFFNEKTDDRKKLSRLLFILDFDHFRQTGKSATGLDYRATDDGPMPCIDLEKLIRDAARNHDAANRGWISPRIATVMRYLAMRYDGPNSPTLKEVFTACNGAFALTPVGEIIAYQKAIPDDLPEKDDILAIAKEHEKRLAAIQKMIEGEV